MKPILTTIILLACTLTDTAQVVAEENQQTLITTQTNAPRPGDFIEKQELQPIPVRQSGDSLLWDLSSHKTGPKYQIRYRQTPDGKIIESESGIVKYYELLGDTLKLLRHGQAGMFVHYQVPEAVVTYPMTYGSTQSGYFYGEGTLSNTSYIRNAGYSTTVIDSRGILVTPDGDTIKNVLRSHYTRTGTTHTDENFRHSFASTHDSSLFSADSILHWLSSDSITHRIERWRWYAPGYRYPIAEAETYKIYRYCTPVDSVNRYYYYRAVDQQYDIEDDYANEQIRYNNSSEQWYSGNYANNPFPNPNHTNNSGSHFTKSNNGGNTGRNTYPQQDSPGENNSGDMLRITYPYSRVAPTIVKTSATIHYGTDTPSEVTITLYNTATGVLWQHHENTDTGDHSALCPMDTFPAGDYLMITRIGDKVFTAKLIKH